MTQTQTRTRTLTFSRTDILTRQLDFVVRATTGSRSFGEVMRKGAEHRWIARVTINGVTSEGKIAQQIRLTIDWDEHEILLESTDDAVVYIDASVPEGEWIAHAIAYIVEYFNEFKRDASLAAEWRVTLTDIAQADRERVHRELGLSTAESREWVGTPTAVLASQRFPSFPELGVEYLVATG